MAKYIKLTAAVLHKGQHREVGDVLLFDDADPGIGNILAAKRGAEVDEAAYEAFLKSKAPAEKPKA